MTSKHKTANIKMIAKASVEERRKRLAEMSKGLAHPARVQVVSMLANRPPDAKCVVGDIVGALPLAQSTVSQHLKILKETGWVQGEIDRPRVCYCLVDGIIEYYLALMERCLEKPRDILKK